MKHLFLRLSLVARISSLSTLSMLGCADDTAPAEQTAEDGGAPPLPAPRDASADAAAVDGAGADASQAPGSDAGNVASKPACQLLSEGEVAAVLGVGQKATELVGGMQCQFSSTDPERKSVRGLLEVVTNGRAIYEANLRMSSETGKPHTAQTGIGDQAAFVSDSDVRSSMMSTRGDVLLRLNLGWGDPGVDSATQLAGERTLMLKALERL